MSFVWQTQKLVHNHWLLLLKCEKLTLVNNCIRLPDSAPPLSPIFFLQRGSKMDIRTANTMKQTTKYIMHMYLQIIHIELFKYMWSLWFINNVKEIQRSLPEPLEDHQTERSNFEDHPQYFSTVNPGQWGHCIFVGCCSSPALQSDAQEQEELAFLQLRWK